MTGLKQILPPCYHVQKPCELIYVFLFTCHLNHLLKFGNIYRSLHGYEGDNSHFAYVTICMSKRSYILPTYGYFGCFIGKS